MAFESNLTRNKGPADVWFTSARAYKFDYNDSLLGRFVKMLASFPLDGVFEKKEVVPVKIHFGSRGAIQTIRPAFVGEVVKSLKSKKTNPFVTDTVRMLGHEYLEVAQRNGYSYGTLGAPVLLADGIFGNDSVELEADEPLGTQCVASAIHDAPSMVVMSHFKGHIQAGVGGAIKHLAMGGVSSHPRSGSWESCRGKAHFLCGTIPKWKGMPQCNLCGICKRVCPMDAISISIKQTSWEVSDNCWRCGRCISACPSDALYTPKDDDLFQKALAVQAKTVLSTFKPGKILYINFLLEMQPECDCMDMCDVPAVQNVGILMSTDPVAIDAASLDLVARAPLLADSRASKLIQQGYAGDDPFGAIHSKNSHGHVRYLEQFNCGSMAYKLKRV